MKLNISQEKLAAGLGIASRAVAARSTLPVLTNVLLTAKGKHLILAATDLETGIICQVEAEVESEGQYSVPARTLVELVATLPKDSAIRLELNADKTALKVRCGSSKTEIGDAAHGSGRINESVSRIAGIPASEFPALPALGDEPSLRLDGSELKEAILQVVPAASEDNARPTLQGVYVLLARNQITFYAADGFRMTRRSLKLPEAVEKPGSAIVPAAALANLARTLNGGEIQMLLPRVGGRIIFFNQSLQVFAQLIEGQYPDIEQVIPKSYATRAVLATAALQKACKQADIFAREGQHLMRLALTPDNGVPGSLRTIGQSDQTGQVETVLEANVTGAAIELGLNATFLKESLSGLKSSNVAVEVITPTSPVVIRPVGDDSLLHILMPMHVG